MKRRKTPQEKKQHEYEESRPHLEVPHAFRKNWPRKKARANRVTRQHQEQSLKSAIVHDQFDEISPKQLSTLLPKKRIHKMEIKTLRERVQEMLKWRATSESEANLNRGKKK